MVREEKDVRERCGGKESRKRRVREEKVKEKRGEERE